MTTMFFGRSARSPPPAEPKSFGAGSGANAALKKTGRAASAAGAAAVQAYGGAGAAHG